MRYVENGGKVAGLMPTGHWEFFDSLEAYRLAWNKAMKEWLKWA